MVFLTQKILFLVSFVNLDNPCSLCSFNFYLIYNWNSVNSMLQKIFVRIWLIDTNAGLYMIQLLISVMHWNGSQYWLFKLNSRISIGILKSFPNMQQKSSKPINMWWWQLMLQYQKFMKFYWQIFIINLKQLENEPNINQISLNFWNLSYTML